MATMEQRLHIIAAYGLALPKKLHSRGGDNVNGAIASLSTVSQWRSRHLREDKCHTGFTSPVVHEGWTADPPTARFVSKKVMLLLGGYWLHVTGWCSMLK